MWKSLVFPLLSSQRRGLFTSSTKITRYAPPAPAFGCLTIPFRSLAVPPKRTKRYKTLRSKKKKVVPCTGPRRLMPAPSLHRKPPTFVKRDPKDKLTWHEREHEKFKQVLGRLEIKQMAWKDARTSSKYGKDEDGVEMRRAATRINPFETIPTFRKKTECGPPPISMKKRKGAVTISRITFEERIRGVGRIRSFKDQMKLLKTARLKKMVNLNSQT